MRKVFLFLVMCLAPGAGAVAGSILGNALGKPGLMVGAVLGGLIGVAAGVRFSAARGWIARDRAPRVYIFSAVGFLVAALLAGNNLWTPLIPLGSTVIIGIAALAAAGPDLPKS